MLVAGCAMVVVALCIAAVRDIKEKDAVKDQPDRAEIDVRKPDGIPCGCEACCECPDRAPDASDSKGTSSRPEQPRSTTPTAAHGISMR